MEHPSSDIDILLEELYAFGRSEGGMWNVGREGGALLAWFIGLLDASEFGDRDVERCLYDLDGAGAEETGGELVTLEVEPRKVAMATENLNRAGLFEPSRSSRGLRSRSLEAIGGTFDLVFIDADKPQYPDYLKGVRDKVRPGSIIVADNVSETNETSLPYRTALDSDPRFDSVGMSIAGGFWVTRVR